MQHKKTLFSRILLAAAIVLAAVLGFCVTPVWNYIVGRTTPLEEAYLSSAAVSAAELSIPDEAVQGLLDGSVTLDEFYAQVSLSSPSASVAGTEAAASSSAAPSQDASQPADASSAPASSTSSAASDPSSAAPAETPSSTASPSAVKEPAASSANTTEASYEREIKALIQQLYGVKARAESGLNQCIQSATAEYRALPPEKQTQAKKVSICFSKAGQLSALQASCDREVNQIVGEMRRILRENGQSTALADSAEATYKNEKNAMYSTLMGRLYS